MNTSPQNLIRREEASGTDGEDGKKGLGGPDRRAFLQAVVVYLPPCSICLLTGPGECLSFSASKGEKTLPDPTIPAQVARGQHQSTRGLGAAGVMVGACWASAAGLGPRPAGI